MFFCQAPLAEVRHLVCVDSSPTQSILKLPGEIGSPTLCLPETPPHPTHKLPRQVHCQAAGPTLHILWAAHISQATTIGLGHSRIACTFRERFLVMSHWCQHELQCLLGGSRLCRPDMDGSWPNYDLWLLCEPVGSAQAIILNLLWPDGISSLHPVFS